MKTPTVYTAFNPSPDPGLKCEDLSLTQQHFKDECDLNLIMERATSTGEFPPERPTFYGDFTDMMDFQTLSAKMLSAQKEFDNLPANIRDRFYNNPANLIDFMSNDSNLPEAIALGLVDDPKTSRNSSPLDVTVTTDTNTTTKEGQA